MINSLMTFDTVSLSDFKKRPLLAMEQTNGILAVLSQNRPAFYCISPVVLEMFIEAFDDRYSSKSRPAESPSGDAD